MSQEIAQEIQRRIDSFRPQAIVLARGPSIRIAAEFLDLSEFRTYGVNDVEEFGVPVTDLVLIDRPNKRIAPGEPGCKIILNSKAARLYIRENAFVQWRELMSPEQQKKVRPLRKQYRDSTLADFWNGTIPYTTSSSSAAASVAWACGFRRIGMIGVDHNGDPKHPVTSERNVEKISRFFSDFAAQALAGGGELCNLSPISSVRLDLEPLKNYRRQRRTF